MESSFTLTAISIEYKMIMLAIKSKSHYGNSCLHPYLKKKFREFICQEDMSGTKAVLMLLEMNYKTTKTT